MQLFGALRTAIIRRKTTASGRSTLIRVVHLLRAGLWQCHACQVVADHD